MKIHWRAACEALLIVLVILAAVALVLGIFVLLAILPRPWTMVTLVSGVCAFLWWKIYSEIRPPL